MKDEHSFILVLKSFDCNEDLNFELLLVKIGDLTFELDFGNFDYISEIFIAMVINQHLALFFADKPCVHLSNPHLRTRL